MTEDYHMLTITRLDESVRNLGHRTGENEKQLAVHEAECALRYREVAQALANLHEKLVESTVKQNEQMQFRLAALQKQLKDSSTKQIMLIRFVGGGMGAAFAAYMAAKSMGWF